MSTEHDMPTPREMAVRTLVESLDPQTPEQIDTACDAVAALLDDRYRRPTPMPWEDVDKEAIEVAEIAPANTRLHKRYVATANETDWMRKNGWPRAVLWFRDADGWHEVAS